MPDERGLPTEREEKIVSELLLQFSEMSNWRNTFAEQWEEISELVWPSQRNTFFYGSASMPGEKKTDRQVDATAMLALQRFGAILDSLLTPRNMTWHTLGASDETLNKNRQVKLWFQAATRALFKVRYAPIGNFAAQNQQVYQGLGAFGNGYMFIDRAVSADNVPLRALRYKALPQGEMFIRENHQGLVDGFCRWFKLTAGQCYKQFGFVPDQLRPAYEKSSQTAFNFLHCVQPRDDYDPYMLSARGKRFASYYLCLEARALMQEGGYNTFPLAGTRYTQEPGEVYGRGPAGMVLPATKTLNAEKRTFLKQGHRAADPVLLTADDGIVDVSLRPGALNKGGVTPDGKPLVHVLPSGNIQTTLEMMQEERNLINDAFLVTLFQILTESPQMTATEVVERVNEKGILLAPTVGRQQSEYLGPMIDRELDLCSELGLLPEMPPMLREAAGEYEVVYTSPLSRQMRAQEAAGFMRTLESTLTIVNATQDPSPLDRFDFDVAVPEIAEIQGVPTSWMASDEAVERKRKGRADALERQQQVQELPAQAAMIKAKAAVDKAGGQQAQAMQGGGPGPG
jgi:hypothetical protein